MKTTVVICSANRPLILAETVKAVVARQTRSAKEIIISVFDLTHVSEETRKAPGIRVVLSRQQGTSVQRNVAARLVQTPYTLFLDDDVELAPNFIESLEELLDNTPDAMAATGFLLADGARVKGGINREQALHYIRTYNRQTGNYDHGEGQNLFVRTRIFEHILFDENLPLYGWLEDLDFATNLLRYGRIIMNTATCFVHLAVPSGRTSGLRYGYSQVVNPLYLWKKNGKPDLARVVFRHWIGHCAINLHRTILRVPTDRADRKGRLRGNMLGISHVIAGRVDPSHILEL
jgi:GT2 family glycosyltransferase